MDKYPVSEIFASVNGEGPLSGEPAVFVRLLGCNLRCSYCDTAYAWDPAAGPRLTGEEILRRVAGCGGRIRNVTLTGGEPLYRPNAAALLELLAGAGYLVNVETNGSVNLAPYLALPRADRLLFCCDLKLPSSGEAEANDPANPGLLRPGDVLKLVIGAEEDFPEALRVIKEVRPRCLVYLSPAFGKIEPKEIVARLLAWSRETDVSRVRVQLQLHKYIWDPAARGV